MACLPPVLGSLEHLTFAKNPGLPEKRFPKQALALDHPAIVWWWPGGSPGQKCGLSLDQLPSQAFPRDSIESVLGTLF